MYFARPVVNNPNHPAYNHNQHNPTSQMPYNNMAGVGAGGNDWFNNASKHVASGGNGEFWVIVMW